MATDLDVTTATCQIEIGLRDTIALALRRRYPAVADVAALRAQSTLGASGTSSLDDTNVELVPVTASSTVYRWDAPTMASDDGDTVVAPDDRVARGLPGRWLKTAARIDGGFFDAVRLYEGEDTEEMVLEKVLGAVPSCLVVWRSEDHRLRSVQPGALYDFPVDFEIWVSSRNLRLGNDALLGSTVADEVAFDPGILNAVGRVKKVLAGSNLGLGDGVDYVQLGPHVPKLQSLSEGQFVHALKIRVKASIHIPDEPGEDFPLDGDSAGLYLQRELVDEVDDLPFDVANHRISGLEVELGHTPGPGLFSIVHAGELVLSGRRVLVGETTTDFAPESDVYRDVFPNGVLWLSAVPIDAPPPKVSGALRVGVSRTNETDVVFDQFLIGSAAAVGEPDLVLPESG